MQEMFAKTVMNLADVANIKKCERLVRDKQRYFDRKRSQKQQPIALQLKVHDVYLQVYATSKRVSEEILKVRLNQVYLSLRI